MPVSPRIPCKGRGAISNPEGRFEDRRHEHFDDGWDIAEPPLPALETVVTPEIARSIISRNQSPDIPFAQSINPYRGCEHGCIYCYARPSHAYLNLSSGLDFETRLFYKQNAAALLESELRKPGYRPAPITLGANTDPYQPIERKLKVTRSILEVLQRFRHPVSIITKSTLVTRDLDILSDMAQQDLANVMLSITTLDENLKRSLEPRAAGPRARLRCVHALARAGVPVGVLNAPIIPVVNDHEIERILELGAEAGACCAGYVLLRLPYEVKDLFREWLHAHLPERAAHVMSIIRQMRGGRDYRAEFGTRMRGTGEYAELIARRFALACRKYRLENARRMRLSCAHFRAPPDHAQLNLELCTES